MQTRSAGRKAANEEATYSEVFNSAQCPMQPCPAYRGVDLDDHEYADVEEQDITSDHILAGQLAIGHVQPNNSKNHPHNELELSMSPLSSSKNTSAGNDYSEPLMLGPRLDSKGSRHDSKGSRHDSKGSRQVKVQSASNICSDYLEPISHKNANNNHRPDHKDMTKSQVLSSHHQPQQAPYDYDYIESIDANCKQTQEDVDFQSRQQHIYDHRSSSNAVHLYSGLINANNNSNIDTNNQA